MKPISRRTFLKDAGLIVAGMGLAPTLVPQIAQGLEEMSTGRAPIVWLQGQSCSGCSVSFLNSSNPGPADLLTRYLSLYFHQTLSAATGVSANDALATAIDKGGYILVVEGAIPLGIPEACMINNESFYDLFKRAASKASAVVSVGACASFGGIPAAPPNVTGATSVQGALAKAGMNTPVINLPGCPTHPDWTVGNLVHVLKVGIPELDQHARPKRTYGRLLHDQCQYFAQYQAKEFAQHPGEQGCQFKMGCQGVVTHSDCSLRGWNGGVNWCVRSRSVCVGCARPEFAGDRDFPFYRFNDDGHSA